MNCLETRGEDLLLRIHVQPGAKSSAVAGRHGNAVKIRLRARPVEGAANAALCASLGLSRRQVALLRGETARDKVIAIHAPGSAARALLQEWTQDSSPATENP
ncbi:MAG: DUF167 domain-containing protein [Acidithiobacillus sp.]